MAQPSHIRAAPARADFAAGQSQQRKPQPLRKLEWFAQLLARVFDGTTHNIDCRFGQGLLRRAPKLSPWQLTAAAYAGQIKFTARGHRAASQQRMHGNRVSLNVAAEGTRTFETRYSQLGTLYSYRSLVPQVRVRFSTLTWEPVRLHSYRSASTGSSFDARSAGTIPLATPTSNNTPVDSSTVNSEIFR